MLEIKTKKIKDSTVIVPGSKSYTHRCLIAAALSNGRCVIKNALKSEDTTLTAAALRQMGIVIDDQESEFVVTGLNGRFTPCDAPIYLGNSGTSMRLLTGLVALGKGVYHLTGKERMLARPIQHLVDALVKLGVDARCVNSNDCPPVEVTGAMINNQKTDINCSLSSQFLSALLLIGPCTQKGLDIEVTHGPVSKPYIDLTTQVMARFGVRYERQNYEKFLIPGQQSYQSGEYEVEPDGSQASYFWSAAAITGARIKVKGILRSSSQGDVGYADLMAQMGCEVIEENDGISVKGGELKGIEIDMAHMPDVVPSLAVVAAFAKGKTIIRNVGHLKEKESDRLAAVKNELTRMGIVVNYDENDLVVEGGIPHGAQIQTYDDHRIAMCFAVAGLKVPGVMITDETCVKKSFPNYWDVFEGLYA